MSIATLPFLIFRMATVNVNCSIFLLPQRCAISIILGREKCYHHVGTPGIFLLGTRNAPIQQLTFFNSCTCWRLKSSMRRAMCFYRWKVWATPPWVFLSWALTKCIGSQSIFYCDSWRELMTVTVIQTKCQLYLSINPYYPRNYHVDYVDEEHTSCGRMVMNRFMRKGKWKHTYRNVICCCFVLLMGIFGGITYYGLATACLLLNVILNRHDRFISRALWWKCHYYHHDHLPPWTCRNTQITIHWTKMMPDRPIGVDDKKRSSVCPGVLAQSWDGNTRISIYDSGTNDDDAIRGLRPHTTLYIYIRLGQN